MGYEIKLYVGISRGKEDEFEKEEKWSYDDSCDLFYKKYKKDENDNFINSGNTKSYFMIYAMLDLCCLGSESNIYKLVNKCKNKSEKHYWYFYGTDGNTSISEDKYGDKFIPIPIKKVLEALKTDIQEDGYRRYKWAFDMLKSIYENSEGEKIKVLFYGY